MPRVIAQATRPRSRPNRTNHGSTDTGTPGPSTRASDGTLKDGRSPKNDRPTYVAVIQDRATHRRLMGLTTGIISSIANTMPPIGVLNVAAMPLPAPAAMSMARCRAGMEMTWPTDEPKAAPIWMIGPSRPTDPPLPMETAEATDLTAATMGRILP